ncbi:hypothetical protein FB446DRAFT_709195 [Lentinula raphanica]|nr:hypothetical protein FB446DRAFT_709195 [Lentinula raphanica]
MAKRVTPKLRALLAFRRSRPTSRADGPGFLYCFLDNGVFWKSGMMNNIARRRREWDRNCPCPTRRWLVFVAVARRRRAEALAHLILERLCLDRPQTYCPWPQSSSGNFRVQRALVDCTSDDYTSGVGSRWAVVRTIVNYRERVYYCKMIVQGQDLRRGTFIENFMFFAVRERSEGIASFYINSHEESVYVFNIECTSIHGESVSTVYPP